MRKIVFLITLSVSLIFVGIIMFLITFGIKTDNFNSLINQKVNEINSKIKLKLSDVNFKLNISNFEFEVETIDPLIAINEKEIDLAIIKFDLNIFEYLNNKNPITKISIISKENDINQVIDFINEYDFNIARNLILKQIKKGKVKISSEISFDQKKSNKLKYLVNGSVSDAEVKILDKIKAEKIKFDFIIDHDFINLNDIELIFDKILITSDKVKISKVNNQFEIEGNLKTEKKKINLFNYSKLIFEKLDILDNQPIDLSSKNSFSFKISDKFKVNDLKINSKLNFDELFTKSKYQDLIYLKNGDIFIDYSKDELDIKLDSNFLFKNKKYNNDESDNIFKTLYSKKKNKIAKVDINLSNTKNKINTKEFKKFINAKNFTLQDQEINFASYNKINFDLNKKNEIKNLNIKSKIKTDNLTFDYKSQRIKKYFSNFKNQIKLTQSNFDLEYVKNNFILNLKSKYSIDDINEEINLNVEKKDKNYSFDLAIDLDSAEIQIGELEYKKNSEIKSNLYVNGTYKKNNEILIKDIQFNEGTKKIIIQNLEVSKNDKIKNIDLFKIDLDNKRGKKNKLEFKKVNDNYYLTGSEFDGTRNIKSLLNNSSGSILSNFKNLSTNIYIDIGKYFVNENSYLSNVRGNIKTKNNKITSSQINAKLNKTNKFQLNIFTNSDKQKITYLEIERPEPFIKNFKFIKGFKEGILFYESSEYEGKITSNLKINDFKVQEVPVLAKLLTLASLQGIADLLTGEGIRFADFEMDYETLGNTTNIKELYAIGPAISLMIEGYIVKDSLTSLKGTLVPATTVNKTISKIPMLGEILVGKKIGEGVFGVSFKIKGPPKKLKTTVNPIKTLTPRFITRTLEKISN